jgi:hypothetical protein
MTGPAGACTIKYLQHTITIIDIYFYETFSSLTQTFSAQLDTLSDIRIKVFMLLF